MSEPHDHDDLVRRLHHLGEQPVDPALASAHLTAMAAHRVAPGGRRFGRLAVAGAAMAGFLFGGLGLGWADALPGPVQGVANEVLERVGPDGPWTRGQCISQAAKTHKGDTAAAQQAGADAKAECPRGGKPEGVGSRGQGQGRPDGVRPHADDPCKGGPPWAGRGGGPTPDEQAAFDAQRAGCPAESEEPGIESQAEPEAQTEDTTPTTAAPTTTTTESTTTTTEATTTTTVENSESSQTTDTTETTEPEAEIEPEPGS